MSKPGFLILHYGPMQPDAMSQAAKLLGDGAVLDTDAARMAGAAFAFGDLVHLDELKTRLNAGVRDEIALRYPDLSRDAAAWLVNGERGMSSEAIFTKLTGISLRDGSATGHPHDPDDLRRCRMLLISVYEFEGRIGEMAEVSKPWAALVARWDELCATMDAEAPNWWVRGGSAPKTYALMRDILAIR